MEKKVSFGFSKKQKLTLLPSKIAPSKENKVELIKCLEGQEIKLVNEKKTEGPLVIPLKEQGKTSAALASLMRRRAVLLDEEEEKDNVVESAAESATANGNAQPTENLETRAARELLAEARGSNDVQSVAQLVLPVVNPDELPLDGAKESSLDDYDAIPVQQYGMAMLRGMGWEEPPSAQKKGKGALVEEAPFVRPKGMGLGADKALKAKPLLVAPAANEVLAIKKQAFVRILGGKHKDLYGQIEGFDDHAGRVIVKLAIGGAKEAFNEFLCQPVSRQEYAEYGKCINTARYAEYKKLENEHGQIIVKKEEKPHVKKEDTETLRSSFNIREKAIKTEKDEKCGGEISKRTDESAKKFKDYERNKSSSHYDNDRKHVDKTNDVTKYETRENKHGDLDKYRGREHRSRSHEDSRSRPSTSSHSRKRSRRRSTARDASESTKSESDLDSAHERRKHKKSSHKSEKSHKKSKKAKEKHKSRTDSTNDDASSSEKEEERRSKKHKKKTKKSKRQRSRSRSRGRR